MDAKEYFSRTYHMKERIRDKEERIKELRELSMSIGSIDYSRERVQASGGKDAPYIKTVMQVAQLEEQLREDRNRLLEYTIEANGVIDRIENNDYALVISKRYIFGEKWEQIGREMGYSERQVRRIHDRAMEDIVIL